MVTSPYYFSMQIWKMECDRELLALACVEPVARFWVVGGLLWVRSWETEWLPAFWTLGPSLARVWRFPRFWTRGYPGLHWCNYRGRRSSRCRSGRRRRGSVHGATWRPCSWSSRVTARGLLFPCWRGSWRGSPGFSWASSCRWSSRSCLHQFVRMRRWWCWCPLGTVGWSLRRGRIRPFGWTREGGCCWTSCRSGCLADEFRVCRSRWGGWYVLKTHEHGRFLLVQDWTDADYYLQLLLVAATRRGYLGRGTSLHSKL